MFVFGIADWDYRTLTLTWIRILTVKPLVHPSRATDPNRNLRNNLNGNQKAMPLAAPSRSRV
jgi:hypothetical protein